MRNRTRAPKVGDVIQYEVIQVENKDRRLRTNLRANRVTYLGEEMPEQAAQSSGNSGLLFALTYLVLQMVAAAIVRPAAWVLLASLCFSAIAIALYGADKASAQKSGYRIAEKELQVVALLGGWPGAMAAQTLFRHKTQKQSFQLIFKLMIALNVSLTAVLIYVLSI